MEENEIECIFCKIIKREIPASIIYEDDDIISFLDIFPINIGHSLIMPKKHFENIFETPEDLLGKMMIVTKKIAKVTKEQLKTDGTTIHINNEKAGGQMIFHVHAHVIPRYEGDSFENWHGKRPYTEGEKELIAQKLETALK